MSELNIYRLPKPATAIPQGYMPDGQGRLVPESAIKPQALLEHQTVTKIMEFAADLGNQIRRMRSHTVSDLKVLDQILFEQYGLTRRGHRGKGNVTYSSFDGLMQVSIKSSDHITFGPELQVAREAFAACIADWAVGAHDNLRAIVDDAFEADKEGHVSREAIFRLLRMDFEDERWRAGQAAIRDSIRVVGSKKYLLFRYRDSFESDDWVSISIDIANA